MKRSKQLYAVAGFDPPSAMGLVVPLIKITEAH
jgi:hypothetical protein